ncbi:MAG: hypothetical protein ACFE9T_00095 [Promethearchaeota archaeon]
MENKFLENLKYRISIKEQTVETFRKFPVFVSPELDKNEAELINIQVRDKYQIILEELDNLIKKNQ